MAKRSGSYVVPFSFELLSFDEAVELAADTGRISGDAGPLLETVVDMLDELGRPRVQSPRPRGPRQAGTQPGRDR